MYSCLIVYLFFSLLRLILFRSRTIAFEGEKKDWELRGKGNKHGDKTRKGVEKGISSWFPYPCFLAAFLVSVFFFSIARIALHPLCYSPHSAPLSLFLGPLSAIFRLASGPIKDMFGFVVLKCVIFNCINLKIESNDE